MKKTFKYTLIAAMAMAGTLCGCSDDKESLDTNVPEGFDGEVYSVVNSDKIVPKIAVISDLPDGYSAAIEERATHIVGVDDANVVILNNNALMSMEDQVLDLYQKGVIIAIVEPITADVNGLMRSVNLSHLMPEDGEQYSIFAFGQNNGYLLGHVPSGDMVREHLNPFVQWLNTVVPQTQDFQIGDNEKETLINSLTNCQQFTVTKPFKANEEHRITKAWLSSPDVVATNGSLSAHYTVYPLYVFPESGDQGSDYYYVEVEYMAENSGMTNTQRPSCLDDNNWWPSRHMWIGKHGGSYNHICALFMTELNGMSELVVSLGNNNYKAKEDVIFAQTPVPETTQSVQEKTVTSNYSFNGSAGVGGSRDAVNDKDGRITGYKNKPQGSLSFGGSISYTYTNRMNVSDVVVGNNQNGRAACYKYTVQNLPGYEYHSDDISISNPPNVSINGANFVAQWVWKASNMPVDSKEQLYLHTQLDVEYGSFFYWAWGTYYHYKHKPSGLPFDFYTPLTSPNRTRTGLLRINNKNEGQCIEQITIYKDGETKPYRYMLAEDGSLSYGDSFNYYLPVGSYRITFRMGDTHDNTKLYELSTGTINISFCGTTDLSSAFNFRETK